MALWDQFITEQDREVYAKSGYGAKGGFGERPAILIIDVNYGWVGETAEPVLQSIEKYPRSCGLEGWVAVHKIQRLLEVARTQGVPVFYTTSNETRNRLTPDGEHKRSRIISSEQRKRSQQIVEDIAPMKGEVVVYKHAPSAFFSTPLSTYLTQLQVDTVLACGGTTSGCVRASVTDANSLGYKVSVIEECTFDRGQASHAINLFDMDQKYGDVVSLDSITQYLDTLAEGLFPSVRRNSATNKAGVPA